MSKDKTLSAANASAYVYDGIGNLSASSVATGGLPAVATFYDANCLNQYQSIWSAVGNAWLEHSENGELTRLGDRGFLYDAKSRLVCAGAWVFDEERYLAYDYDNYDELYSFVPVVSNRYDHLDRRVQKITPAATHTYFYDGWMLIKEIVANTNGTTDVIEYHWGKDLSGTIGGAGGVGGLLYLAISNSSTPNSSTHQLYIPFYDAYGNVMGYWDAQGNVVAEYTYDAFGKLIASLGPMADVFAIRYSTKYFDIETGLYYYGYRFYSPELMRWITRDPIGEEGGVNLYAMCGNNAICGIDFLGRFKIVYSTYAETTWLEYFKTGEHLKEVTASNENNVYVESKGLDVNGLFDDAAGFTSDCQFDVLLRIFLADDLQLKIKPFDTFITLPHETTTDGYSRKKGGGRPMKGAILAHERGHAKAFFEYQKPLFETKIAPLISKPRLTEKEQEEVKKAYKAARKEVIKHSARLANEAEKNWYISNGFEFIDKGGLYEFKR